MADSVKIKIDGDDSGFKKTLGGLGNVAKKSLAAIGTGVVAAGTALTKIGISAVQAYGEYEQLVGGVETLFGAGGKSIEDYANSMGKSVGEVSDEYGSLMNAQETVMQNAANAFSTAGLSANEYMETVTSFSASLLQSVGGDTEKAAAQADKAVIDMADNANKMGTSMEMIQNAYQGFAKQNFTMLDNLKLGYGGTKTEMERLLADAEKIKKANGETVSYSIDSFSDMVEAIHVVQENMGITGTTADEAATTIQGSLNMTKAAWENLMTGLADTSQDLDSLIGDVINSATTFVENVMPIVETVLESLPPMLEALGTKLLNALPDLINTLLPLLADAVSQLLTVLVTALKDNASILSDTVLEVLMTLVDTLLDNIPMLIETALILIVSLAEGLAKALPELIPAVVDTVLTIVDTLIDNVDMLIDGAIALVLGLAEGIIESLPRLIERIPEIILKLNFALIENAPKLLEAAFQLNMMLAKGLVESIPALLKGIVNVAAAMIAKFREKFTEARQIGKEIVTGIWNGISSSAEWLKNNLKNWCNNIKDTIKGWFGIHSPSRVMRDEVGKPIVEGIAVGIKENAGEVSKEFQKLLDDLILQKDLGLIDEAEYYAELEKLRDNYFEKGTEEWWKYTKQIIGYEESLLEEQAKTAEKAFDAFFNSAKGKIDGLQKEQEKFADKLKSYGDLFDKDAVIGIKYEWSEDGKTLTQKEVRGMQPADLKKQTQELKAYADNLEALKGRTDIPQEFFATLRDLSIEDGTKFTQALLDFDDEALNQYIADWKEKQETADEISKQLYSTEYENIKNEITDEFGEIPEEFFKIGEDSGTGFMDGFRETVLNKIQEVCEAVQAQMQAVMPTAAFAGAGGTSYTNNYQSTYVLQPSSGESTQAQLSTIRKEELLNKLRGR